MPRSWLWMLLFLAAGSVTLAADKTPILIDTDLGTAVDDPFALGLALASPELELVGVTTAGQDATLRARMALRFLHAVGRERTPVAAGAAPQPERPIAGQYQYYYHPAVLFNRAGQPQKATAVEFLHQALADRPGELTLVALGPLTNIARLLKEHPEAAKRIKRVVVSEGIAPAEAGQGEENGGRDARLAPVHWRADVEAAQAVLAADVPLVVIPAAVQRELVLSAADRERLFGRKSMLTLQIEALHQMAQAPATVLADPLALAILTDETLCTWEERAVAIDERGALVPRAGDAPRAQVAVKVDARRFFQHYLDRLTQAGATVRPRPLANVTRLIEDERFPAQVHVFEDYETDIEKRWWLAGRLEREQVPAPGGRAFRSQLTLDFDDLQGQLDTLYSAVVFNPVPGPPMGARPRLKFRYRLEGTDELRVQIYSLSNGYHRYLALRGLPREEWREATVDMTAARRPDGSGGPLSKDERIDDIQFYVDPRATVLIDDIILYSAGDEDEQRPFPGRLLFTGWFDTGKQGVEWPGAFEIVEHQPPRTWKGARSITPADDRPPILNVSLRGARPVSKDAKEVCLDFDYHLKGAQGAALPIALAIALAQRGEDRQVRIALDKPADDAWRSVRVRFPLDADAPRAFDELRFEPPAGATLTIDNVLLYEEAP